MKEKSRILGLDILRALAVLSVLWGHTNALVMPKDIYMSINYYSGFVGVELFFVLSGFLIGTIIIKMHERQEKTGYRQVMSFWIRRWFRTLPNFYLVLIAHFVVFYFVKPDVFASIQPNKWSYFLFLQNVFDWHSGFFGVSWSLTIEEWFYLSFPLALLGLQLISPSNKKKAVLITVILYLIIELTLRLSLHHFFEGSWPRFIRIMPLRLDSIAIGVLIAWINFYYPKLIRKYTNSMALVGLASFVFCSYWLYTDFLQDESASFFLGTFFLTAFSLSIGLAIPFFNSLRTNKNGLTVRAITHISLISYSIYLIHMLFIGVIHQIPFIQNNETLIFVCAWVGTLVIASFQYYYFEKPMTALRTRFTYKGEDVSISSDTLKGENYEFIEKEFSTAP